MDDKSTNKINYNNMKQLKKRAYWLQCMGTLDADRASSRVTKNILRFTNSALPKTEKGGEVWL